MSTTRISSTVTTTTQAPIQIATTQMTYYGPIILLIIGIIGCICNFVTFTAPQLRKSSCAFYFLVSTVFELLSITFGLISRFAADHLGSKLQHTNQVYCKLRAYLVSALPLVATYLILLSSIDRYMSSSVHVRYRLFSQMKIAYRATIVAICIGFISCVHILVSYDLRPKCATMPGDYAMFDSMFVVFWLGVIPHVLMLIFGSLTIMNIKQSKRRIAAKAQISSTVSSHLSRRQLKTDTHLIAVSSVRKDRIIGGDEIYLLSQF